MLSQRPEPCDVTILRSLPGVGRIVLATLLAEAAWFTDRLVGVEELGGVGERPFLALDAHRAVQAQPGPPPPHPATAAQGHELAGLRRQLTAARCDLSCQSPITPGGWRRKAREGRS